MATTKPRITVTLTQRQYDVLKVISDCGGQPMSAFISQMLEMSLPTLERMAATFQKIKRAQDGQRAQIVEALDEAQSVLEPIALGVVGQFDLFMGKVEQAAGVPSDTARAGAVGAPAPAPSPLTNRGVTPNPAKQPKAPAPKPSRLSSKSKVFQKPAGCTCTYTDHERMENKACPVHKVKG